MELVYKSFGFCRGVGKGFLNGVGRDSPESKELKISVYWMFYEKRGSKKRSSKNSK